MTYKRSWRTWHSRPRVPPSNSSFSGLRGPGPRRKLSEGKQGQSRAHNSGHSSGLGDQGVELRNVPWAIPSMQT
eukprot:8035079-Pyramimonas_sp.AAC.1